jgi:8-oxo-dGTP pyrophosphatase MutT (NUDIX family)
MKRPTKTGAGRGYHAFRRALMGPLDRCLVCHVVSNLERPVRRACRAVSMVAVMVTDVPSEASRWTIHAERVIDDTRRARFSIAEVELPDGVKFEQYVLRMPKAAIVVVLNDEDQVLMMWRHRFIIDRWVWELPGGYVDTDEEDPAVTAAREVEEETGWRPRSMELLLSFQPMVGTVDSENLVYLARGADHTGAAPDINEAELIGWVPLDEAMERIGRGEIVGSASVVGLMRVKMIRDEERRDYAAATS